MIAKTVQFQKVGAIGVVQFATSDKDTLRYIGSRAAMEKRLIEVKEVSATGNVNNLLVTNNSDEIVFFMDGDILTGAKQDRVLNTSMLIGAKSNTQVPVSCVERGRWRHTSSSFSPSPHSAPFDIRAEKSRSVSDSLKRGIGHKSDQGRVWNSVSSHEQRLSFNSPTEKLTDLFTREESNVRDSVSIFTPDEKANGLAVFHGMQFVSIDIFNRSDIFREYFPKILSGIAFGGFMTDPTGSGKAPAEAEANYKTVELLDSIAALPFEEFNGVCLGRERRFNVPTKTGFELRYQNLPVHTCLLEAIQDPPRRA